MNRKKFNTLTGDYRDTLRRIFNLSRFRLAPSIVSFCSFIISVVVAVTAMNDGGEGIGNIRDFETGKVADRDVIAMRPASYIDEEATRLRMDAQEQLVPAVFRYSAERGREIRDAWVSFSDFADRLIKDGGAAASFRLAVQAEYPALFSSEILAAYFAVSERRQFREAGLAILDGILAEGVFDLRSAELKNFNPDVVRNPLIKKIIQAYNEQEI
jgi:hypothetical protein